MLTVIEMSLKQKTGSDVTAAMEPILQQRRKPTNLQTDRGKEFYNYTFQSLMQRINLYSSYSNLKASICKRCNRTLKQMMWILFSLRGKDKWLNILPNLLNEYNNSKHRTTGMKSRDMTLANDMSTCKVGSTNENVEKAKI